ncbi:MAG: hypothetical protein IPL78_24650, partial [Chloroflexi bacterium]|nr:hypothetical protein [Chloroflexota bacterium]
HHQLHRLPTPPDSWAMCFYTTLAEAAELAIETKRLETERLEDRQSLSLSVSQSPSFLRGLFSGGTLAYEAVLGLQAVLSPLYSNVPITAEQKLADPLVSQGHTILDLGEDIFTQGRLHPMMDNDLRLRRLRQEAADPETGLIWLDVVLGEGAHPDPAHELAPAIAAIKQDRPDLEVVVLIIGTDEDPQDVNRQMEAFAAQRPPSSATPPKLYSISPAVSPQSLSLPVSQSPSPLPSPPSTSASNPSTTVSSGKGLRRCRWNGVPRRVGMRS